MYLLLFKKYSGLKDTRLNDVSSEYTDTEHIHMITVEVEKCLRSGSNFEVKVECSVSDRPKYPSGV